MNDNFLKASILSTTLQRTHMHICTHVHTSIVRRAGCVYPCVCVYSEVNTEKPPMSDVCFLSSLFLWAHLLFCLFSCVCWSSWWAWLVLQTPGSKHSQSTAAFNTPLPFLSAMTPLIHSSFAPSFSPLSLTGLFKISSPLLHFTSCFISCCSLLPNFNPIITPLSSAVALFSYLFYIFFSYELCHPSS